MDVYFSSLGRNGVLLLNIPPDKRGLISDADVKNLQAWKKKFDAIFASNLLNGAIIKTANGINNAALIDGKFATYFTTKGKGTTAMIEFDLKQSKTFNVLMLQEDVAKGQRIVKFSAEYFDNGSWVKFAEGTTVGYKRLLKFDKITTGKVRVKIEASRLNPYRSGIVFSLQKGTIDDVGTSDYGQTGTVRPGSQRAE
jgi:alpha-L-fucosidase